MAEDQMTEWRAEKSIFGDWMVIEYAKYGERSIARNLDEEEARLIAAAPARDRLCEELADALEGLLARWAVFTRSGWGNQEQAYYNLAKHAQKQWAAARAALTKAGRDPQ